MKKVQSNTEKPELLAPAGDFEKLKVAFHFGADAVYAGLKKFSLRAHARNFSYQDLKEAIDYTHQLGKKLYLTFNVFFTQNQVSEVIEELKIIGQLNPDAIIVSDPGVLFLLRQYAPHLDVHMSTQANICNQYAVEFYKQQGVKRIVLARELSLAEIKQIQGSTDLCLETFIHGAMCISYSGRCLLSAYMTKPGCGARENEKKSETRSANQGNCVHSCRWQYRLVEESRPDQAYDLEEDQIGSYILSSKDLCMIDYIGPLVQAGVSSFKIEGRMKSILYISSIIRAYRRAIDHYYDDSIPYQKPMLDKELNIVSHREFCTGFYFDQPLDQAQVTEKTMYERNVRLAAMVTGKQESLYQLKLYNSIRLTDHLEIIGRDLKTIPIGKMILYNKEQEELSVAHQHQEIFARFYDKNKQAIQAEIFDILRMEYCF